MALVSSSDQLRPFLDESAGGFVERLFEALEESRTARGNRGAGEKNRKRDLKVSKLRMGTAKLMYLFTLDYSDHSYM